MKIANREARAFVQRLHPFEGNNLYGTYWCCNPSSIHPGDSGYAVFSYGDHWPLFVSIHLDGKDVWFENEERHSMTTSKHKSQTHPQQPTNLLPLREMVLLVQKGYRAMVARRLNVPSPSIQTEFHREVA